MIKYQQDFTATEAEAICEMLAILANDDYVVEICHIGALVGEDGEYYYPYSVIIKEKTADQAISTAQAYRLIDALQEAYQKTPEAQ